ncbi:MAG: PA2779 family protein [Alphaproteobacteria bacterium]|nr:PA2779 family protein [Alphaproteobacteria bacterium]
MFFLRRYSRFVALPLAALMMAVSMPIGVAQAALVGTDQVIDKSEVAADRARVAAFLAREDVRRELQAMGVNPDEATARVTGLTDAEVQKMAARIDTLPAGQGVAEALIGAALLIFIVLLVTDLMGVTDVFPFVKGGKARK